MDESTFRLWLSQRAESALDLATLEKGADYLRRGRVRRTWYDRTDAKSGALHGNVQGSAPEPYTATVRIALNGSAQPHLRTQCTCPLGGDCKHVAALVLKALDAAAPVPLLPADPPLGPWASWLDTLEAPAAAPVEKTAERERVFGFVLRLGAGALPGLQAQPVWLTPGKRGGFVAPRPIQPHLVGDPWAGLSAAQFEHVAQLRMRTPASAGAYLLTEARDEALLEALLADYPCFMDRPSAQRIALGPQRALGWQWQSYEDGSQKLMPVLAEASPKARLLRIGRLWLSLIHI